MPENAQQRPSYPSDLSDAQWGTIHSEFPTEQRRGRPREINLREVVDGINYRWNTGCVWRMLPHDFPPWGTVYSYFRRWQRNGTLRRLREELLKPTPHARRQQPTEPAATSPAPPNDNRLPNEPRLVDGMRQADPSSTT